MSRVRSRASVDKIAHAIGVGGNLYLWSLSKDVLEFACRSIGKSPSSIYMNSRHSCWAVRIKNKNHKRKFYAYVYLTTHVW